MGSDELDNLLAEIRAESKKESALALYEGTRETDLVSEDVDERILNLLGLEDVFDIDYSTYLTLLKERLAAARMTDSKIPVEEDELLTGEFRRVRGKVGRFKIKKTKISSSSIVSPKSGSIAPIQPYQSSQNISSPEIVKTVENINVKLDALLAEIREGFKKEEDHKNKLRNEEERKKRKKREDEREKGGKALASNIKSFTSKLLSPFKSIFDKILNFFKVTFLSFAFDKLIKWFTDPANKKKIEVLGRFLKNFWPVITVAAVRFLTPFGGFVKNTLKLLRFFGRQLIKFMARNPAAAAALVAGVSVASIMGVIDNERKKFEEEEKKRRSATVPVKSGGGVVIPVIAQSGGGVTQHIVSKRKCKNCNVPAYSGGGMKMSPIGGNNLFDIPDGGLVTSNTGEKVTGAGVDTQLTALRPGEVVFSKEAVNYWGEDRLLNMNKMGGGTNTPKTANITLASGGGVVPSFKGGGVVNGGKPNTLKPKNLLEKVGSYLPGSGRVMQPQANYPSGQYGRFTEGSGYMGKSQFMLLGLPVPGTQQEERFSESDVNRYNNAQGPRIIERMQSYYRGGTLHRTIPNTGGTNRGIISPLNVRSNVDFIQQQTRKQIEMMKKLGYEPDGYDSFFKRAEPIERYMGPQSSNKNMIDTPVVATKTQVIMLPQQHKPLPKAAVAVKDGTDIPDFNIVSAGNEDRDFVIASLGLDDIIF